MVWWVKPRELKSPEGGHSGKWRLCAESDEDGGFHPLCSHEHGSAEEAWECPDAIKREGYVTGMPRRATLPTIGFHIVGNTNIHADIDGELVGAGDNDRIVQALNTPGVLDTIRAALAAIPAK